MSQRDLLIEIGTEELPIEQLDEFTHPQTESLSGPNRKVAFDEQGEPTKAALGFAKKCGVEVSELEFRDDKLFFSRSPEPLPIGSLLQDIVETALKQLPIAKRMRWGSSRIEFVRPVHWLVMLFGNEVIDATVLGIKAGRQSRGHRFHCDQLLEISSPTSYPSQLLEQGHVVADFSARREQIVEGVEAAAKQLGGQAVIDPGLLNEVTALVEKPVPLAGRFDEKFLSVPAEALISSMGEHQKYFHVVDNSGKLMPHFITVSNIQSTDPAQVIDGNERVIRPRLADAAFFFETDKKTRLEDRRDKLGSVVFQQQLGTVLEKTERIGELAAEIAAQIQADVTHARRAGELCKADLVSDMVLEFDKMQGIAGRYYAQHDGEPDAVAMAIEQHYLPRHAGDALPETDVACSVALADRIDTLTGIFGIGQAPTGSKDPFALRRASIAVLQIIVQKQLTLDLRELLEKACALHQNLKADDQRVETILSYMLERFRAWYQDEGIAAEVFMAVSAKRLSAPLDIHNRVQAVHSFSQLEESQALAAANKRVSNILNKVNEGDIAQSIDNSLLTDDAEKQLSQILQDKQLELEPLLSDRKYEQALASLASLRQPVDAFFDNVMVMADEPALRANRLAILSQLRGLFLQVADISCLALG